MIRLIDEDAIIIGRINCDEFAMGSTNENSVYGPVKNPLNPLLTPGGSSGGCAAAISASELCHVSLGKRHRRLCQATGGFLWCHWT